MRRPLDNTSGKVLRLARANIIRAAIREAWIRVIRSELRTETRREPVNINRAATKILPKFARILPLYFLKTTSQFPF